MSQGHVPNAEAVVVAEDSETVLDHVPPLDPHQARELAFRVDLPDLGHRPGKPDEVRVPVGHAMDCIDALECDLHRLSGLAGLARVDGPELHVQPSLADPRKIHVRVAHCVPIAEVPGLGLEARCGVRVRVHDDRIAVEPQGTRFETLGVSMRRAAGNAGHENGERDGSQKR